METKLCTTWYRCLFCTRVFPKAAQLIEHRKLSHALQWKERKLAKRAESSSLDDLKAEARESVKNLFPDKTGNTLWKSKDCEINSSSAEVSREGNENPDSNHINFMYNSENRKTKTMENCLEMDCNGMEIELCSPGQKQSDIDLTEDSTVDVKPPKNYLIGRKFLHIEIRLTDCFKKKGNPLPKLSSEADKKSEIAKKNSESPLRKSGPLLSPIKTEFPDRVLLPVFKIDPNEKTEEGFVCSICNKTLSSKRCLLQHQNTHEKIKSFKCDICYKTFASKGNVTAHKMLHAEELPFKCDICRKSFAQKGNLKTHKMLHTGDYPFQCSLCNKAFRTKAFLAAHEIVHRTDRNFKCVHCSENFRTKGILKTHSLKLHGMFTWNGVENKVKKT